MPGNEAVSFAADNDEAGSEKLAKKKLTIPEADVTVRRMTEADAAEVAEVEAELFLDAWSEASLTAITGNSYDDGFVCVGDGGVLGYCLLRQLLGEGEILRIGVRSFCRRQGLAENLLRRIFTEFPQVTVWNLEVRESNRPAIGLYEKMGFLPIGVRKNYYHAPTEPAVLMQRHEGDGTNV